MGETGFELAGPGQTSEHTPLAHAHLAHTRPRTYAPAHESNPGWEGERAAGVSAPLVDRGMLATSVRTHALTRAMRSGGGGCSRSQVAVSP